MSQVWNFEVRTLYFEKKCQQIAAISKTAVEILNRAEEAKRKHSNRKYRAVVAEWVNVSINH